jgi:alkylation response protein AidB-like acyl-CoA dehydrogenase
MEYNEMQKDLIESGKTFIEEKIAPNASLIDEKEEFPMENFKELGKFGVLGIPYPEEYFGIGRDYMTYIEFIREIAHVCAATAMTVVSHSTLTCNPIFNFGSEYQKDKYLGQLIRGDKIGAFALTEPNSGSDMSAMETKAIELEDCFLINGSKVWITNANVADIYVVAALTAPAKKIMGISLFILEKGMAGLSTSGKSEKKLGMRGSDTGELIFEDVKVPKDNLIGRMNFGLNILHQTLVTARLGMAAIAVGISEAAQKYCLQYVKQRKQFGKYIYHFQSVKNIIADMEMNINAASLLLQKATLLKDRGENITKVASEAKLFASETAMKVTKDAIQLFGAYGYSREMPLERFFRDAKITEIGDGTSEIQRIIIADEIIKRN